MGDLKDIRLALKAALVNKLGTADQTVSAYVLRDPNLPCVWVRFKPDTPIQYHQAMGNGLEHWQFYVEAYTGSIDDESSQVALDEYVSTGPKSIFQALEADITLGGVVQNVIVRTCNAYVEFVRADSSVAIGANWLVEVYP